MTLDIDWAPDFVVESVAQDLRRKRVRATWFVTHESPVLDLLRADRDLFELGIHPNFRPGSTHGATVDEVVEGLLRIVPEAVTMRTHGLVQSGDLIGRIATTTTLKRDVSTFLPEMPNLRPVAQWRAGRRFTRLPFFWADDHEMNKPEPSWSFGRFTHVPGLKIFDFHPLFVYLNLDTLDTYSHIKRRRAAVHELEAAELEPFRREGDGVATMFAQLTDHLWRVGGHVISELG